RRRRGRGLRGRRPGRERRLDPPRLHGPALARLVLRLRQRVQRRLARRSDGAGRAPRRRARRLLAQARAHADLRAAGAALPERARRERAHAGGGRRAARGRGGARGGRDESAHHERGGRRALSGENSVAARGVTGDLRRPTPLAPCRAGRPVPGAAVPRETSPQFSPGAVARASRARQIGAHVGPSDADVLYSTSRSEGRVRPEMARPWRSQKATGEKCGLGPRDPGWSSLRRATRRPRVLAKRDPLAGATLVTAV